MKYSDYFVDQLVAIGYTHCFYVSGGNVMHLLESARTRMKCIAVTHEVSAAIAAEYFNVANRESHERAMVMVTAGPGLTNLISGIAGAWLESRELLVVGGQARSNLLSKNGVRQIGHQEIDGVTLVKHITKAAVRVEKPISGDEISQFANLSRTGRKGPVFLEVCLDVTLLDVNPEAFKHADVNKFVNPVMPINVKQIEEAKDLLEKSQRPLLLVGGGLSFDVFQEVLPLLENSQIPVATTWNACDYIDYESPIYAGRPNTYGMRWANAVIQQCDLLISVGARLGLQQTGFNVEGFAPLAKIVRVEIDPAEIYNELPKTTLSIQADANHFLPKFLKGLRPESREKFASWINFIRRVKTQLPINEEANEIFRDYTNPFRLVSELSQLVSHSDSVIPCSSGGAYTSMMQAFMQKRGNLMTNNKGLASMGYGLAGAIGTAVARRQDRVILVEGDGGFTQNLQELGTVANNNLNLKMFIFDNSGYASIRISQKAYFDGNYLGCDKETGVHFPDWSKAFDAWGISSFKVQGSLFNEPQALDALKKSGPCAFIVKIHQDQPFLPKITSRVNVDGSITSNPLHLMQPSLPQEVADDVFQFLPRTIRL